MSIVMLYYKGVHLFFTGQAAHIHRFDIGIYDSKKRAEAAVEILKTKEGFKLRPERFYIIRVLRFKKPLLLNQTYWMDGFTSCKYK